MQTDSGSPFGVFVGTNHSSVLSAAESKPAASPWTDPVYFDSYISVGYESEALEYWEGFTSGIVSLQEVPITTQTSWQIVRASSASASSASSAAIAADDNSDTGNTGKPISIGDEFYLRWAYDPTQWVTGSAGPITIADQSQATVFSFVPAV